MTSSTQIKNDKIQIFPADFRSTLTFLKIRMAQVQPLQPCVKQFLRKLFSEAPYNSLRYKSPTPYDRFDFSVH